ncbi:MAG: DUF1217 domain-containing protein, partial [Pseudomonadota bacterium]
LADQRFADFSEAFGFGDRDTGFEIGTFQAAVELNFRDRGPSGTTPIGAFELNHFRTNIGAIATVEDLVSDPISLDVALQSFGLERGFLTDDFFRQLLTEGADDPADIVFEQADPRFVDFVTAFDGLRTGSITQVDRFALVAERQLERLDVLVAADDAENAASNVTQSELTQFRLSVGTIANAPDPAAALVADPVLREVTLAAFGLAGSTISDADLEAVLRGGGAAGAPAFDQADSRFVVLAEAFDGALGVQVPSFQRDVEVGIAQRDLEFVAGVDAPPPAAPSVDPDELAYFRANIDRVETAEDLTADRRLLDVALASFGLGGDTRPSSFFQDILDSDLSDPNNFVFLLSDTRLRDFALAFTGQVFDSDAGAAAAPDESDLNGGLPPALLQYAVEERLIANGAPEEDLFYLRQNFDRVNSGLDLALDERLADIALSAFGVRKGEVEDSLLLSLVVSDVSDPNSFVNVFGDERFIEFASVFGQGAGSRGNTGLASFQNEVVDAYQERLFEVSVGNVDQDLRLALNFRREIEEIAQTSSETAGFFGLLGSQPLREVIQGGLGLPPEFAQIDLDTQVERIRAGVNDLFGTDQISAFRDPANVDRIVELFLLNRSLSAGAEGASAQSGPSSPALTLLQGAGASAAGPILNITV